MQRFPITSEGHDRLKAKLKNLKEVERPQNVRDIEEARAHGDLSENAEYHAAKERQGLIAASIAEVEDKLARVQVIDISKLSGDKVMFGATVVLLDIDKDEQVTYQILGDEEADAKAGRISISAPLARALLGKTEGDEVKVQTPGGERLYEVLEVTFAGE